jgi:hypothetical protein
MNIDRSRALFAQENARGYALLARMHVDRNDPLMAVRAQERAATHGRIARANLGIEGTVVRTTTTETYPRSMFERIV